MARVHLWAPFRGALSGQKCRRRRRQRRRQGQNKKDQIRPDRPYPQDVLKRTSPTQRLDYHHHHHPSSLSIHRRKSRAKRQSYLRGGGPVRPHSSDPGKRRARAEERLHTNCNISHLTVHKLSHPTLYNCRCRAWICFRRTVRPSANSLVVTKQHSLCPPLASFLRTLRADTGTQTYAWV